MYIYAPTNEKNTINNDNTCNQSKLPQSLYLPTAQESSAILRDVFASKNLYTHSHPLFAIMSLTTKFVLLISITTVYGQQRSSASCAYTAMGMIATPLDTCSIYSMDSLSYSSKYTFDQNTNSLIWHYYDDLECDNQYKEYEMDDVMMNIHHMNIETDGSGSNCDTVDITIYGNYNSMTDECEDDNDDDGYQTKSFVINECISSPNDGSSATLMCNQNKLYFNYCKSSLNCECDQNVEQIIYEYYQDDCFEFECNDNSNNNKNWMISHSQSQSIINKKSDARFLKNLITQTSNVPFYANKIKAIPAKTELVKESMSVSMVRWLYIVIGGFVFVICCAISRYINSYSFDKEYAEI